jgi:hypothetical protein
MFYWNKCLWETKFQSSKKVFFHDPFLHFCIFLIKYNMSKIKWKINKFIGDLVLVIVKGVILFKHNWKHINEAITEGPMTSVSIN